MMRLLPLVISCFLAGAATTATAAPAATKTAAVQARDISGIPELKSAGNARFPAMTCNMQLTLPKAVVPHVRFKLEFGPGKVQQINFDEPKDWSAEAKPQLERVTAWSEEVQDYMACLREWRNDFITELNPVIEYFNTVQDLVAQSRHRELEVLDSPLRSRGAPLAYTCRLDEPVMGEPNPVAVAAFDNCVQRHVEAHERFIDARRKELADNTQAVIKRVQLAR